MTTSSNQGGGPTRPGLSWSRPLQAASAALGVMGTAKSFKQNPILGDPALNRRGLHRERVRLAARMAAARRARLARRLAPEDVAAFDRDGYVLKRDWLPAEAFDAVRRLAFETPAPAREMRQGRTVTRHTPLGPALLARCPSLALAIRNPDLDRLFGYVAGRAGAPVYMLQTVLAGAPEAGQADPQTDLHADTFHATAKLWLFLTDVGEDDGPFAFVPGSHRLTAERLAWEHRQSLTAAEDPRRHHALGSFRARPEDLEEMGLPAPIRVAVPANTLVIADTFGFHGRSPSPRATTRVEIHGHLRRPPFPPWNGLDPLGVPGVRGRQLEIYFRYLDWREKRSGKRGVWRDVGEVTAADGPSV